MTDVSEPPSDCWDLNPTPEVLFTTEPSLQPTPLNYIITNCNNQKLTYIQVVIYLPVLPKVII